MIILPINYKVITGMKDRSDSKATREKGDTRQLTLHLESMNIVAQLSYQFISHTNVLKSAGNFDFLFEVPQSEINIDKFLAIQTSNFARN